MKTTIKSIITRVVALALTFIAGSALAVDAPTPVAVWNGNLADGFRYNGVTLSLNGNSVANGVVAIDQTKGVQVNFGTAMTAGVTVLFKYSDLPLDVANQAIATSCVASNGTGDRTGVYLGADNKSHGIWGTGTYDTSVTTQGTLTDGQTSGVFAFNYKGGAGTYLYRIADGACSCIYGNPKLMSGNDGSIYGCALGGPRDATTFKAMNGLKILAVAVFDKVLSVAEMESYQFPYFYSQGVIGNYDGRCGYGNDLHGITLPATDAVPAGTKVEVTKMEFAAAADGNNNDNQPTYIAITVDDKTTMSAAKVSGGTIAAFNNNNPTKLTYAFPAGCVLTVGTPATIKWYKADGVTETETKTGVIGIRYAASNNNTGRFLSVNNGSGYAPIALLYGREPVEVAEETIDSDTTWTELWGGSEPAAGTEVALTVSGSPTLTLDTAVACNKVTLLGDGNLTVVGNSSADIDKIKYGSFTGTLTFEIDATAGYTADDTLKAFIKDATTNVKFVFKGSEANGATINFGDPGKVLATHLVFEGGTHAMTITNGNRKFASGATGDDPTVLVKGGTTLNFTAKDLSGYSGGVDMGAIVRVNDTAILNFLQDGGNTFFYSQRLWLDPGALVTFNYGIKNNESAFRWYGGVTANSEQIYVPASDTDQTAKPATIQQLGDGAFHLATDGTRGVSVFVGANSKLVIDSAITTGNAMSPFKKTGDGVLAIAGDVAVGTVEVAAGTIAGQGTFTGLTVDSGATLDLSGYGDAAMASGDVTIAAGVSIRFPTGFTAESAAIALCEGTLAVANQRERYASVYVGASTTPVENAIIVYDAAAKTVTYEIESVRDAVLTNLDTVTLDDISKKINDDAWTGDVKVEVKSGAVIEIGGDTIPYSGIIVTSTGAVSIDYTAVTADNFAKYDFAQTVGTLTITTGIKLDIDVGERALVYTYTGDDSIAPALVASEITINTEAQVDVSAGAAPLTYNYNGDDELTPAISTTGAFTKGGTGTLCVNFGANRTAETIVNGGVLKTTAQKALGTNYTATINANGVLDFNGYSNNGQPTIVLNGGILRNTTTSQPTSQMQILNIRLTASSTIDAQMDFGLVGSNHTQTALDLGEYTLTKIGDGQFHIVNTAVSGSGTIKVAAGSLHVAASACTMANGTVELDGGNLALDAAFSLNNLTIKNGALAANGALTLTGAFKIDGATVDFSSRALPLVGTLAADSTGTLKITKPTKAAKIIAGTTIPSGLTIVDENGAAITPISVCGGYICYGTAVDGEYTLTEEDADALAALAAGDIYAPLVLGATSVSGVPEGFFGWAEDGNVYVAQKSNSINIKFTPASDKEGMIATTDVNVGGYPVAGKFWNHSKICTTTGVNTGITEVFYLKDGNGADAVDPDGNKTVCYYYAPNMYDVNARNVGGRNKQTTGNGKLTYSYFDDPNQAKTFPLEIDTLDNVTYSLPGSPSGKLGWEVAIENVPYQIFDLYIYQASDQTADTINLMPIAVKANDGNWKYFGGDGQGSTIPCDATLTWHGAPYCDSETMVEGTNYIRYRMSKAALGLGDTEKIEKIYLSHPDRPDDSSRRLGLAGVQIVQVLNDGYFFRNADCESTDWVADGAWKNGAGEVSPWANRDDANKNDAYATIDADAIDTININDEIVANLVTLKNAEPADGAPEKVFTFTASEDCTLTAPIDATGFYGKIVLCEGMTGVISLGEHAYIEVEVPANTTKNVDELLPTGITISGGNVKVTGAGTLVCDGALPTAYQSSFQVDTWTGTLYLKGFNWQNFGFGAYGHAGSKIKVTGITGFGPNSIGDGVNPELILEDIAATEQDPAVKALLVNNGYSNKDYFFRKVTGSGTFGWDPSVTTGPGSGQTYIFKDTSDFDGVFDAGAFLKIVVGNTTAGTDKGSITFADGLTVKAGLGWTAQKAYFGETLTVKGALGDTLVEGLTAAPTSVPAVTLDGEEGAYTLKFDNGSLVVAYADIEVTIPEVTGATPTVTADGESVEVVDNIAKVPYGTAALTVTYTADEGKLFTSGEATKVFDLGSVITAPTIDVTGIETTAAEPTATVAQMDPIPDGLDDAATFTAGPESKLYSDWKADFIFSATEDFAKDSITLKGLVDETWTVLEFAEDYTAGEKISVLGMIPEIGDDKVTYPMFVQMGTFGCGLAKNSLAKPMSVTIDLVLTKEGEEPMTLATYDVAIEEDKVEITGVDDNILYYEGASYVTWGDEGKAYFDENRKVKVPYGAEVKVTYLPDFFSSYLFFPGGTFEYAFDLGVVTEDMTASLPSGVTVGQTVAMIDDVAYPSLADAVAAAADGAKITMLASDANEVTINKSLTIEVSATASVKNSIKVNITAGAGTTINLTKGGIVDGTIVVDGGTVNFSEANDGVTGEFTGTLEYKSGTVTKSDDYTVAAPEGCEWQNGTLVKSAVAVDPEVPQTYDDDTKAAEAAAEMNGKDGTIKPEYINAPAGFEGDKAAYAALFAAVADGNKVTVQLTMAAEAAIKEDLANPANEATILTPDENGEATIVAKPGLYYGVVAEDSLDKMADATGKNWVLATGDTVKVPVPTVTDADGNKAKAAFFRPTCSAKAPTK